MRNPSTHSADRCTNGALGTSGRGEFGARNDYLARVRKAGNTKQGIEQWKQRTVTTSSNIVGHANRIEGGRLAGRAAGESIGAP